jgi:pimeloyl-ACP methyl ester carboxylesterase
VLAAIETAMGGAAHPGPMPKARVDGIAIDYDDSGKGEPAFLLMAGWCGTRRAFDAFTPLLNKSRRVVALDWRGHGGSDPYPQDFGEMELVEDALAALKAAGNPPVIPVATAHAGWVAIELRRRLGARRVPALVLIDWIVGEAPPPFLEGLKALQGRDSWKPARDGLFAMWTEGVAHAGVARYVKEDMAPFGAEMWARAGREIAAAYAHEGSPLRALAALTPPAPTLHVYAQPPDPGFLKMQQEFAREHPWFHVRKLDAASHFPTIEVPDALAREVLAFAAPLRT